MAKEYLDQLSEIMKQATARRFKDVNLECKHFFSGAAVYADGRICISLTPVGFAIKLPETSRDVLLKEKGGAALPRVPRNRRLMPLDWQRLPRGGSSVGRAPALQAGGRGFDSHPLH